MGVWRRGQCSCLAIFTAAIAFAFPAFAQSSDSNFPTPLTTNVINSTIKARDIGDARLTTYYYAFGGEQGDVFINVVTKNFDGNIDIFSADGMRPLTKMVIYSDSAVSETGRLVYLRKAEKLLIRIEGRPPDDRPATIQVKFAGSFVAMKGNAGIDESAPTVSKSELGNVRVNSVGTIIEAVEPKKPDTKKPQEAIVAAKPAKEIPKTTEEKKGADRSNNVSVEPKKDPKPKETSKKPPVQDSVTAKEKKEITKPTAADRRPKDKTVPTDKTPEPAKEKADPLANVRLVVSFKNGDKLERPLTEILKFSVDKGVLTVIAKDGSIRRYMMVDVAEVTIK